MPVSRAQFVSLCTAATGEVFQSFVAGLYEARGRDVERAGAHLVVSTGARTRTVAVLDARAWTGAVPGDADAAVVADDLDSPGEGVTDAVGLHRQLRYAVERSQATALLEAHFGRPPASLEPPGGPEGAGQSSTPNEHGTGPTAGGADDQSPDSSSWQALAGVVLAGCLLVAGVTIAVGALTAGGAGNPPDAAATPIPPAGGENTSSIDGGTASTDAVETTTPTDGGAPISSAFPREGKAARGAHVDASRPLPPGIVADGIADETALIDAHRSILANSSYRLTLTYREFVDGHATGVYTEQIRVANGTRYAVSTARAGEFRSGPRRIALTDVFADGRSRFERTDDGVRVEPLGDVDPFLDDVTRYLGWYLSVRNASVSAPGRDGGGLYRLTTQGDPYPGVRNSTGTAFVTDRGLIRDLRRVHERPSAGVRVVVRIRVTGVGETAVNRPLWVDRWRNRTRGSGG